jgi:hypothetical protein
MRALWIAMLTCVISVFHLHAEEKWESLFDGKTLNGWTPKIRGQEVGDNYGDTFTVKDGCITVQYDKDKYQNFNEKFGHLFYKDKYSHYKIRLEYRFIGDQCPGGPGWATRNSGIMIHGQDPKTMTKDQKFPVSVEVQLLGGLGKGNRTTANMCSPGTNIVLNGKLFTTHCTTSKSKTYNGDGWVNVEVEVHGSGKIIHRIEGDVVMEYEQPQYDPKDADAKPLIPKDGKLLIEEGTISLQSESHPVQFRKIEVQKLPAK